MQASTKITAASQQVSIKGFECITAIRSLNKHELVRGTHDWFIQWKTHGLECRISRWRIRDCGNAVSHQLSCTGGRWT